MKCATSCALGPHVMIAFVLFTLFLFTVNAQQDPSSDSPSSFPSSIQSDIPSDISTFDMNSGTPTSFLTSGNDEEQMESGSGDARCTSVNACSSLAGDCCPTMDDVDLYCCGTLSPLCSDSPNCVLDGKMEGSCCPNDDGIIDECCDLPFAACAAHSDCAHLSGDCCPTASGKILDCCVPDPTLTAERVESNPSAAACAAMESCANLAGDCCPTNEGVFLYCCGNYVPQCEKHPLCAALNLTDNCCPTDDGSYLSCCSNEFASPKANPDCPVDEGNLCPNINGTFNACCRNDTSASSLVFKQSLDEISDRAKTTSAAEISALFGIGKHSYSSLIAIAVILYGFIVMG
jgi:hypothetical protein